MLTILYLLVLIPTYFILYFGMLMLRIVAFFYDPDLIMVHRYSQFMAMYIFWLNPMWKIKVEGLENIKAGQNYIILPNHQSMLDIPLLFALPGNYRWVGKRILFYMPLMGWFLLTRGDVPIDRGNAAAAKKMINDCNKILKRGLSMVIFPEGTRSRNAKVGRFKLGAFVLAKKAKVPLLPVIVNGTNSLFDKGIWYVIRPHTFTITVLPAVSSEIVEQLEVEELKDKLHCIIKEGYANVKKSEVADHSIIDI